MLLGEWNSWINKMVVTSLLNFGRRRGKVKQKVVYECVGMDMPGDDYGKLSKAGPALMLRKVKLVLQVEVGYLCQRVD